MLFQCFLIFIVLDGISAINFICGLLHSMYILTSLEAFSLVRQAAASRFARWREMTLHLSSCNPSFLKRSGHEVYSHLSATLTNKLI